MSYKNTAQVFIAVLLLLAFLAVPSGIQAGGTVCGGTYIVQWGDTLSAIAERCKTSVDALYAANPGISSYLYAGQVLVIPGLSQPVYPNAYVVQPGDTFAVIAARFGVTVNSLQAANPHIQNINLLYPGQILYLPVLAATTTAIAVAPAPTPQPLIPRSYGTVPPRTPYATIKLINKAKSQVYVSLQGTTTSGVSIIREYPVSGWTSVRVPAGWYIYVAWVGGKKFEGQFKLGGESDLNMSFYANKVVVE